MGKRAAILLSRQPRRPSARSRWEQHTLRALDWVRRNDLTVVSSVGMQTWELITASAVIKGLPIDLRIPVRSPRDLANDRIQLAWEYSLTEASAQLHPVVVPECAGWTKVAWAARDDEVVEVSDIVVPVAVSPSGSMRVRLEKAERQKEVVTDFEVDELDKPFAAKYDIDPATVNPALDALGHGYLFHWTRASQGCWPGERPLDYYRDVMLKPSYPRDAIATLTRIVSTGLLSASSRHMPENTPTVSFTGLTPRQTAPLMRWRARYGEMTFEPYGIGIRRSTARSVGVSPVRYYDADAERCPADCPIWLTQSIGDTTDWSMEDEYRCRGDLSLSKIDRTDLLLVTADYRSVRQLQGLSAAQVIPFCVG